MSHDPAPTIAVDVTDLHPSVCVPSQIRAFMDVFRDRGWLRIEPILAPGLAAELAALTPHLPLTPHLQQERGELSCRFAVTLPAAFEPQYPHCLFRLRQVLTCSLPTILSAIVGCPMALTARDLIDIHVFRKGSFMDDMRSNEMDDVVAYMLGLTGSRWPSVWGGHIEILAEDDTVEQTLPLGWNTLDVFPRSRIRMPVLRRHVQGIAAVGALSPSRTQESSAPS